MKHPIEAAPWREKRAKDLDSDMNSANKACGEFCL
jgi:hypothetical protein